MGTNDGNGRDDADRPKLASTNNNPNGESPWLEPDIPAEPPSTVSVMFRNVRKDGAIPASPWNVYMALRNHDRWVGRLHWNELTESVEYHQHPDGLEADPLGVKEPVVEVDDDLAFRARLWLDSTLHWTRTPGSDLVHEAIDCVAKRSPYHPIRNYLTEHQWDGVPRLDHWLVDYCGAEAGPYTAAVGRRFLIGACERAFRPGCKMDTMLVLVGPQGIRKSQLVRILGRGWSTDTPIEIGNKDAYEALRGGWLIEFPELAGMGGKAVERLKAFFSSPEDVYRPPYARKPVRRKRSCVFFGTTNDADFLRDATGSRRYWCVRVGEIDLEALESVVDQLWAEAALAAHAGEQWWLTEEEAALAENAAEQHLSIDPWEDKLESWLEDAQLDRVHTREIYDRLEIPTKDQHTGTAQRVVRIMCGRLKWERPANPIRIHGYRARGFVRPGTHIEHGED